MINGKCALCNNDTELVLSHIIPKFVINLLKARGMLRSSEQPNQRVQDGKKLPLLCPSCEELLSRWEKNAYENIFQPLNDSSHNISQIQYGTWALKFAVSVSWRVLLYSSRYGLPHLSKYQKEKTEEALETWRKFLLGELPNPGHFEQHFLTLNLIKTYHGFKPSPFMNRYIMLTSHMEVAYSEKSVTVCTKMGNIFLFGLVQKYAPNRWKGTKLHVNSGSIMISGTHIIPEEILHYINKRANEAANVFAMVSDNQREVINDTNIRNIDEIANSDVFLAMQHDIMNSGQEAFKVTESSKHSIKSS